MKCHYEVLDVARDVNNEDLKKAYRKAALKWHPDKNIDNPDFAKEQFQLVQQAYEVLSDPHERAWYDNHRDAILKGGLGGDYKDDSLDVFPYFTTSCFKGYGDDEGGFYSVYREVFNKIAAEDSEFMEDGDSDYEIPAFGNSSSDFKEVVQPFYAYWQDYTTKKSFSWLDQYDIKDLPNRRVAKLVEKENKKIRDRARKDRNEQIRALVAFVRKRDKRVQAQAEVVKQQQAEKARLAEEKRKSKVRERQQKLKDYKETEWAKFSNFEDELKNIEKSIQAEYGDHDSSDDEVGVGEPDGDDDEEVIDYNALFCEACKKLFKTEKAFANHENSKKHKENVEKLRQDMLEEDLAYEDEESDSNESEGIEEGELNEEEVGEEEDEVIELESGEEIDSDGDVAKVNGTESDANIPSKGDEMKVKEESENSEFELPEAKSKKKKKQGKKPSTVDSSDDDDLEGLSMLSKKQRRKLQQQQSRVPDIKAESDAEEEIETKEEDDNESTSDKPCDQPKTKLKGKKAKDARKQKKQAETTTLNSIETGNVKASSIDPSRRNKKHIEVDPSTVDTEHTCVSCASSFGSKNKLFEHLKKTGHSVFLPNKKSCSEPLEEKKKGKGRRK
ncbi:DnaJ-like protein subfamily C member 21 [Frankliniella fusca]|uniref:DnaJ homolog subfamily C member 21 n=1 Tax=Frankliniella fusca TaxID=407009 RepID=A0AAE1HZ16_9NEOP|nr:DnaJ-like protein subfamily C member 21 [Frankliniella fusca]